MERDESFEYYFSTQIVYKLANLFDQCQFNSKDSRFHLLASLWVEITCSAYTKLFFFLSWRAFLINQVNYTIWPLDAVHLSIYICDCCCCCRSFYSVGSLYEACIAVDSSQFSVKRVDRVVCWKLQQCINEFFLFSFAELHSTMFIFGFVHERVFMQWMMVVCVCICRCLVVLCAGCFAFNFFSFFFVCASRSTTAVKTWLFL